MAKQNTLGPAGSQRGQLPAFIDNLSDVSFEVYFFFGAQFDNLYK